MRKPPKTNRPPGDFLNYAQAAADLDVSQRTLESWVAQRQIAFIRVGRQIRFTKDMLAQFTRDLYDRAREETLMAGVLIYPKCVGMMDEIGHGVDHVVIPHDVPIAIGAFSSDDGLRVRIALPLPYGRWTTADISLSLFLTAADAFVIAHGDPRDVDSCPRCGSKVSPLQAKLQALADHWEKHKTEGFQCVEELRDLAAEPEQG